MGDVARHDGDPCGQHVDLVAAAQSFHGPGAGLVDGVPSQLGVTGDESGAWLTSLA